MHGNTEIYEFDKMIMLWLEVEIWHLNQPSIVSMEKS